MNGWPTSDYLSLITTMVAVTTLFISLITALATVSLVPNKTQKVLYRISLHTAFFSFLALSGSTTHLWITGHLPFVAQSASPASDSTQESPSPTPSPALQSTPKPFSKSADSHPSTSTQSHSTPFSIYTNNDQALRAAQCLVGDFDGEYRRDGDSLIVSLTNMTMEMCRKSSDCEREIKSFRVGIGDYDEVMNNNKDGVAWSEKVDVEKTISNGDSITIPSHTFLIQERGMGINRKKAVIIELSVMQRGSEWTYPFIG